MCCLEPLKIILCCVAKKGAFTSKYKIHSHRIDIEGDRRSASTTLFVVVKHDANIFIVLSVKRTTRTGKSISRLEKDRKMK